MMDWNGVTSFELDLLGRVTSVNDHNDKTTGYTYDSVSNQTSIAYPDGSTARYTYDLLGRLTNLKDAENQNTVYAYDAASQLISQAYANGWDETYEYDSVGQLLRQYSTDPSNAANKSVEHLYTYDAQGNVLTEYRSGSHGMGRFNLTHTYDALNRLTKTTGDQGYKSHEYTYDSLGNLTYEKIHNKGTDYKCNNLNQQIQKIVDGKDTYNYSFDSRGNLVQGIYTKKNTVVEQYVYDASNRMVKGTNESGEQSHYIYNGLGYLVGNEWIIKANSYGYHGVNTNPSEQVDGVVRVCTAHKNTTGQGHKNPTGAGHFTDRGQTNDGGSTTGGTEGGILPTINNKQAVVHKDYVLDYTSPLKNVILETESGVGGLTYRYVYGLEKVETVITGITNGAGSVMQYVYGDETGELVLTSKDPGKDVVKNSIVKLWYHHDNLGSTDYLTSNVDGKVISYVTYDDWGALTAKAVLKMGSRELDLVQSYTTYDYDMVLGVYFAQARIYDAGDRRFMAADPVKGALANPQTLAQYTYVLDNPRIWVDPLGNTYTAVFTDRNGKIVGGGMSLVDDRFSADGYFGVREVSMLLRSLGYGSETLWQYGICYLGITDFSTGVDTTLSADLRNFIFTGTPVVAKDMGGNPSGVYFKYFYSPFPNQDRTYVNLNSLANYLGLNVRFYKTSDFSSNLWLDQVMKIGIETGKYLQKSLNQLVLGNYTDDVTWLGTSTQVIASMANLDLPMDIRDLVYDIQNWEWS